jgi:hypothetical protein
MWHIPSLTDYPNKFCQIWYRHFSSQYYSMQTFQKSVLSDTDISAVNIIWCRHFSSQYFLMQTFQQQVLTDTDISAVSIILYRHFSSQCYLMQTFQQSVLSDADIWAVSIIQCRHFSSHYLMQTFQHSLLSDADIPAVSIIWYRHFSSQYYLKPLMALSWLLLENTFTKCCSWVVNTPALCLEGPVFKSQAGDRLSWPRFLVVFLSPSRQMLG